jgi:hypothetical protein
MLGIEILVINYPPTAYLNDYPPTAYLNDCPTAYLLSK